MPAITCSETLALETLVRQVADTELGSTAATTDKMLEYMQRTQHSLKFVSFRAHLQESYIDLDTRRLAVGPSRPDPDRGWIFAVAITMALLHKEMETGRNGAAIQNIKSVILYMSSSATAPSLFHSWAD